MSILTIIVLYNSNYENVCKQIDNLRGLSTIYIFDNSDSDQLMCGLASYIESSKCIYASNNENMGIAYAQNQGLKYALNHGFEYVFLVDDDSEITELALNGLKDEFELYLSQGYNLASLSLQPDERGGLDYYNNNGLPYFDINNLMSSGSLISIASIRCVGFFDEDLFIDFVDYDWGWRAQSLRYSLAVSKKYKMQHRLGNGKVAIFGHSLGIPSPIRHFYQTRNLFLVLKRKYVPLRWKITQLVLLPIRFVYFSFLFDGTMIRFNYFIDGLVALLSFDNQNKGKYKGY